MKIRLLTTLAALLAFTACGDGTGPTTGAQVSLTFATNAAPAAAATPAGPAASHGVDPNTLVLSSVKIVLREIELEAVEVADCDVEPEPAGCEDFETGPRLFDLVLNGVTQTDVSNLAVPVGTYDEIEFDIHKVSSSDGTFVTDHPEMEGKSILVEGTYNGNMFTFETDLNEEQERVIDLVVLDANVTTNVTINVDVDTWFLDEAGHLFDPATAAKGGPNEGLVKNNIKNSIDAFEDHDHDGSP